MGRGPGRNRAWRRGCSPVLGGQRQKGGSCRPWLPYRHLRNESFLQPVALTCGFHTLRSPPKLPKSSRPAAPRRSACAPGSHSSSAPRGGQAAVESGRRRNRQLVGSARSRGPGKVTRRGCTWRSSCRELLGISGAVWQPAACCHWSSSGPAADALVRNLAGLA